MHIEIPEYVEALMNRIATAGEESYVVGGSLRDSLLGKSPSDYDVATSATPERMVEIFSDYRVIKTGLKHGTLTVMSDGHPIEITAFRIDGSYTDSRHPDSVSFTRSIVEDLSRRDFTVNAMAYSRATGLVDVFGGREDLENGIIRAVRQPELRFGEDALRIMRAFRFSAQLGFEIEEKTLCAAQSCRDGLSNIARERIATEFFKLLCSEYPQKPLLQMRELGILDYVTDGILPSERLIELASKMPKNAAASLGLLLCECGEDDVRRILDGLKCSNAQRKTALAVAKNARCVVLEVRDVSRLCTELGEDAKYAISASILLGLSDTRALTWLANDRAPHSIKELSIGGDELARIGFVGREIGKTLAYLLRCATDDPTLNTRERLLELAREKYREGE
ncbi:MAG: polynucleotide adenylyltransferase [Clostridia bacterium]|nr:polynucleotide adenylyltransferase [Clostridia bacterium]